MNRLLSIKTFNISKIRIPRNSLFRKTYFDPITNIFRESSINDNKASNDDITRYIFNYEQLNTPYIEQEADSTKITKQLLTITNDKYVLDTFDGEEFVDFNIIDIHPYKQRITLAISKLGKTIVTEEEVRIDSKNHIYFEYGVSADIKKIYIDRFLYEE